MHSYAEFIEVKRANVCNHAFVRLVIEMKRTSANFLHRWSKLFCQYLIFFQTSEGGKRVLALKLTDGVVHVKGMELEPILCLDPLKVLPGCKVVLIHKITCRRGVLLLRPQNVRILGGKVATLIPSNTPVHLFASVL